MPGHLCEEGNYAMRGPKYIQMNLFQRFSEKNLTDESPAPVLWGSDDKHPERLSHFLKTAECRKRQILEKMLMD